MICALVRVTSPAVPISPLASKSATLEVTPDSCGAVAAIHIHLVLDAESDKALEVFYHPYAQAALQAAA